MTLLPPPVSLDILIGVTGLPPVEVLQIIEEFTKAGVLQKYKEKGAGYYMLSDFEKSKGELFNIPSSVLCDLAHSAIEGICRFFPDNAKRWLNLAHIYQVSGVPVAHIKELVEAGHYCSKLNLPKDAAAYYRLVLESCLSSDLTIADQKYLIDATISLCNCMDFAVRPDVLKKLLDDALQYEAIALEPHLEVKVRILIAKTYYRSSTPEKAVYHIDTAWRMLGENEFANDIRLEVALAKSELYFWQGYLNKAIELYESIIGKHEELPSDPEALKRYIRLGWTYGAAGETARGVGLIKRVSRKVKELGAKDLERYAKLILVLVLCDAGRIDEAEPILDEIFETPLALLDNYYFWPGNGKRAYVAYCRGNFAKAFEYQKQAWDGSKVLGTLHQRGPDNLEVMLGLESRGMVHPEWNFASEIERLINWPDIYMQGVAYRYRGLKAFQERKPIALVKKDLEKCIELLTEAGAKIELSHARVQMARLHLFQDEQQVAENLLKIVWERFSKINPNLFPNDLKHHLDKASKYTLWVESLLGLGDALGTIRNREELLGQIIKQAMRIAGAERGCILLRQGEELEIVASRNFEISQFAIKGINYRKELVKSVFTSGREIIKNADFCRLESSDLCSVEGWIGSFPIILKGKVLGVLYMDCGLTQLQLPEEEVSLLRIIANQAAVALDNVEAYEEIIDLKSNLEAEAAYYREIFDTSSLKIKMIGKTEPFKEMLNLISRVAKSDTTVMITGETGVGKDLVAQAIHQCSNRSKSPYVAVNVVALSPELMASELFGHEKGAFTGAGHTREGRFELASIGTLFLDDIDAFSLDIQAKMLRVLEAKEFQRVGSSRTIKTRFRLVAASNRNIEELVERGQFRSDFYYRLNVFPIHVPPLRERADDIPGLAHHFLNQFGGKFGKKITKISKKNLEHLQSYHWPGNVRELLHVIERAVLLSKDGGHLIIPPLDTSSPRCGECEEKIVPLKEMETQYILKALAVCNGKVHGPGGAAELLDVKPTTLYSKMQRLGIQRRTFKAEQPGRGTGGLSLVRGGG